MRKDQDNIRTMFDTAISFLDAHGDIWKNIAAFVDAVMRAKAGVQSIDTSSDKQQTPTTGVTQEKLDLRNDLEFKTLATADPLSAFAAKNGKHDLGAQVELTKSYLDKLQDSDLEQIAERVHDLANDNLQSLADYGITAATLTALDNARKAFLAKKTAPREKVAERKAETMSLRPSFANVRSIFRNEIDKLMTPFRLSNSEFYNGYFAARSIINQPATHEPSKKTAPAAIVRRSVKTTSHNMAAGLNAPAAAYHRSSLGCTQG